MHEILVTSSFGNNNKKSTTYPFTLGLLILLFLILIKSYIKYAVQINLNCMFFPMIIALYRIFKRIEKM